MATLAISSGCFGFSNRLARKVARDATRELGTSVGVEVVVPRWGLNLTKSLAVSAHYPLQFDCKEKLGERTYWALLHGGPQKNPTHKVGLPIVVHAPTIKYLVGELGEDGFYKRFGNTTIWLENAESDDPQTDPIGNVIDAVEILKSLGMTAGVCYDVGHAATHALSTDRWRPDRNDRFICQMAVDLGRMSALTISAAHIHDVGLLGQDHRPLYFGFLSPWLVAHTLVQRNPNIQLTLEANYVGRYTKMVAMRIFGCGYRKAEERAICDLALLKDVIDRTS